MRHVRVCSQDARGDKVNGYMRFKSLYLDENRLDQPDLILDIRLRSITAAEATPQANAAPTVTQPPAVMPAAEPPAPPLAAVSAAPSDAAAEQLRLQAATLQKEIEMLQAAEAKFQKYGSPGGSF